jgi:biotin transport system substrate-specific component
MHNFERLSIITAKEGTWVFSLIQVFWITVFCGLTAVGAQIWIPNQPVPFTLQTFFVLLSGAFLGSRNGFIAQILYITIGTLGAPVFTGGGAGLLRIFGPTGGYLISFPIAAVVVGYLVRKNRSAIGTLLAMSAGLLIIFTIGTLILNFGYIHNIEQSLASGFLIFSWWDILKLTAAAGIYSQVGKKYHTLPL